MSRTHMIPSVVEHDGVLEVNIGWHGSGYHNETLRPVARIAGDRCKPLFKAWSRRAVGFGMDLNELLASCYLQGVTDGIAAAALAAAEPIARASIAEAEQAERQRGLQP